MSEKHTLLAFDFEDDSAYCSCEWGIKHKLTPRAASVSAEVGDISKFEYSKVLDRVVLAEDVEKILMQIGGLFH